MFIYHQSTTALSLSLFSNFRIVDFMIASEILAVTALLQFALVQYLMHTEESLQHVIQSLNKSSVLQLLDSKSLNVVELFENAIEKHRLFCESVETLNCGEVKWYEKWWVLMLSFVGRRDVTMSSRNDEDKKAITITNVLNKTNKVIPSPSSSTLLNANLPSRSLLTKKTSGLDNNTTVVSMDDEDDEEKANEVISNSASTLLPPPVVSNTVSSSNTNSDNRRSSMDVSPFEITSTSSSTSTSSLTTTSVSTKKKKKSLERLSNGSSFRNLNMMKRAQSNTFDDLEIAEVLNLINVNEAFNMFDCTTKGYLTPEEFRQALRYFGYFYSRFQACAIIDAFWSEYGTSLNEHPHLDLETFLRLLIRHETHKPNRDIHRSIWSEKPSMICDVLARIIYPLLYLARLLIFVLIMHTYHVSPNFYA
jgi:hypothetical protein